MASGRGARSLASPTRTALHFSGRGLLATLTGIQVLATGGYVPETVVDNEDLADVGFNADWIMQRTGIRRRRRAPHEATSDLAYEAAVQCSGDAQVSGRDVDLILVATMTPDTATPSVACTVQRRLEATAPAMDLNAACSGFVTHW